MIFMQFSIVLSAGESNPFPFLGEVNANNINVRCDSTISSQVVISVNKGDSVEVISELYDWYKIKLPKTAPLFIRKDLVNLIDEKTGKVIKDRVNFRLLANESSPIIGSFNKDEVIKVLEERGGWYKIEPLSNSFGWIHKKFVNKKAEENRPEDNKTIFKNEDNAKAYDIKLPGQNIAIIGIINPYGRVFRRIATHKLIDKDNKIFLLKGNREIFNSLTYQKVKVMGKIMGPAKPKYSLIEVEKIEVLD